MYDFFTSVTEQNEKLQCFQSNLHPLSQSTVSELKSIRYTVCCLSVNISYLFIYLVNVNKCTDVDFL